MHLVDASHGKCSLQLCPGVVGRDRDRTRSNRHHLEHGKFQLDSRKIFLLCGWPSTKGCCPERLWSLHSSLADTWHPTVRSLRELLQPTYSEQRLWTTQSPEAQHKLFCDPVSSWPLVILQLREQRLTHDGDFHIVVTLKGKSQ